VTLMREIEWDACLLEPRASAEFKRRYRRETGRPDATARYFLGVPWIEDVMIAFSIELGNRVSIDPNLADLAGMVVSQDNSCRFCFASMRAFLRILGMSQARISQLEQELLTADFSAAERAALEFARRVSRANPLPAAEDVERLRAHGFSELQIAELAGVIGLHLFFNRLATICALPPQEMEELPDRWYMRLLRPLIAVQLRRIRRQSQPIALRPDEREGPFSHVVVGLDGLPVARALRAALEGMWNSTLLSRRAKALVIAVVGRALGCPLSEDEAARLLLAEGLDRGRLDEILAHLTSPILDPVEQVAVSFAPETVWYEPAQIQRRGREVMQVLSREQFIELVAVASLANVLCRLAMVLHARG